MSEITIYHNPRCSKSRETLALIRENGVEPEIREYLKEIPSKDELKLVLAKLDLNIKDILRKGEKVYKDKFKGMNFTDEEWITIVLENPKLIERPIVIKGNKAVLGRPPENVLELL
ncbi:MAG TPA: arsenate reductase (glutaredoxin) [Flavobacteriales bacterium]|nr:arsenate reductase (glutaredoxin) [Flavobacteriales bacterium]|tara:strand:- start:5795 stop:6142 length:348 start_codon:yes stop_codon:yes gene_type:complete